MKWYKFLLWVVAILLGYVLYFILMGWLVK